jgi:hypothetical protein
MARYRLALATALVAVSAPAFGSDAQSCGDCPDTSATGASSDATDSSGSLDPFGSLLPNGARPLTITIESDLKFSRLGLKGREDGDAEIDPQTGDKHVGPNMIDLGGLAFQGKATVTGQPLRPVRIELPDRVLLHSPTGAEAELSDFRTDLPPVAMLNASGVLEFSFGATITSKDAQGGNFRGRIPIRVDYF